MTVGTDVYIVHTGDVDNVDIDDGGIVAPGNYPGEFEQMVLLAVLRLGDGAYALSVLKELDRVAGRMVSRGALYKTLDRMESKDWIEWEVEDSTPTRGGHPRRLFSVTAQGLEALRASREALLKLWDGLGRVLEGPS